MPYLFGGLRALTLPRGGLSSQKGNGFKVSPRGVGISGAVALVLGQVALILTLVECSVKRARASGSDALVIVSQLQVKTTTILFSTEPTSMSRCFFFCKRHRYAADLDQN